MSLKNRVMLWISLVLLFSFVSIFAYQIKETRQFLHNQQEIEVDNTIHMLGLALRPILESGDSAQITSVVQTAFDGSFYEKVSLKYHSSEQATEFEYPHSFGSVPDVFKSLVSLNPIEREIPLSAGWVEIATLTISSNVDFAYQKLWLSTKSMLINLLGTFFLVYAVISVCVHMLVSKPLDVLIEQMNQVTKHRFNQSMDIPKTHEFKEVAVAFNNMSLQLDHHFKVQAEEAEKFRKRAYQDTVTKLANREFLLIKLKSWLQSDDEGGLMILSLDYLNDCYEQNEFKKGDDIAAEFGARLKDYLSDDFTIGRMNPAEFIFISPNVTSFELSNIAGSILDIAQDLQPDPMGVMPLQAAMGIVMKGNITELSEMLALADNALPEARRTPAEPIYLVENKDKTPLYGRQQWQQVVEQAIANDAVGYTVQAAIDKEYKPIYKEVFSWISKDDQVLSAGAFLPAIEKLEKGSDFDRHVITSIFERLEQEEPHVPYAINLTINSVTDSVFLRWLEGVMDKYKKYHQFLLFEIPEVAFIKYFDYVEVLCDKIHQHNFAFGIDNFGHNFSSMSYLKKITPDYVKLDFAYTSNLDQDAKADVLRTITQSASNLDIKVIATRIEAKHQIEALADYSIDGFQGYVVETLEEEIEHG